MSNTPLDPKRLYAVHTVFGILLLSSSALVSASTATLDELGAVNAETVVLRAQAAREEARRTLLRAKRGKDMPACAHTVGTRPDALPQTRRITAINGIREATLMYADRQVEVREGDTLTGGYVVQKILPQARRVDLKSKTGRIIQIPVSGATPIPMVSAAPLPQPSALLQRLSTGAPSAPQPPGSALIPPAEQQP